MELINLTGHLVRLFTIDREIVFEPRGKVKVSYKIKPNNDLSFATVTPIHTVRYIVKGLPEPKPGKLYIVSSVVFNAVDRDDLVIPYGILKHNGEPYGCTKLLCRGV